jgi:uncharacterized protein
VASASVFAVAGVPGAFLGSTLGETMNGQRLLALFAVLMIIVWCVDDHGCTVDPTVVAGEPA